MDAARANLLNAMETLSASTPELAAGTAVSVGILWMLARLRRRDKAADKTNTWTQLAICVMVLVAGAAATGVFMGLSSKLFLAVGT